jgi:small subunit ribosomal protein S9
MTAGEDDRDSVEPEVEDTASQGGGEAETKTEEQPEVKSGGQAEPPPEEQPAVVGEEPPETKAEEQPPAAVEEQPVPAAEEQPPAAEKQQVPAAEEQPVRAAEEQPPAAEEEQPVPAGEHEAREEDGAEEEELAPRVKPAVPGAHLEVDIVPEGVDPLGQAEGYEDVYAVEEEEEVAPVEEGEEPEQQAGLPEPIATAAIDLAAGARYRATGKRKTAIARVTLRPGTGAYLINGRALEMHFPRLTLQRNIRQPLETVGYQERMDVIARLVGGGISAQAGALRHGVSRALLEADPNLRGELKRRGFLTRDSRVKERKKAGLKKARKRPQFSKR